MKIETSGVVTKVETPESSSIDKMIYESDAQLLTVKFKTSEKNYEYPGVTEERFKKIIESSSVGKEIVLLKKEMQP